MEFDNEEYQKVVLAGLLHDIGKFYQRTGARLGPEDEYWISVCCKKFRTPSGERYSHQHSVYTGKFIRHYLKGYDDVEVLAMHHHMPDNAPKKYLAKMITLADWLASGERRDRDIDEEPGSPARDPLISIFSMISLDGKRLTSHYTPISPLVPSLSGMFPTDSADEAVSRNPSDPKSYVHLWDRFIREVEGIDKTKLLNQLVFLMEKYTLCIPAATYKDKPDLSLFHHSKSVAAVVACLYQCALTEEELGLIIGEMRRESAESNLTKTPHFFLVGGDISGIQDFIYSVTSEKALKGLRGRSFYLQLLSESIAKMILNAFRLPDVNLIYCGGGHFYLLLPLLRDAEERLRNIKKDIDKKLLTAHKGKLAVILEWQPLSCKDFVNFGNCWTTLGNAIAKGKRKKFSDLINGNEEAYELLGPSEKGGERKACEICGEEVERGYCDLCSSFANLSSRLARAKVIKVESKTYQGKPSSWSEILESFGYSYNLLETENEDAFAINCTDFVGRYAGYKFVAHHTPKKGEEVMTLEDIADEATNLKRWGVLRADVDNLSRIFLKGLGEDRTISRVSMLSYMLSLFFSARVDEIVKTFGNKAHVVYSGGDDLFILGAWSELPEIALRIYRDFTAFTCQNMTLSGGIYIAPSQKFPVYQAADEAGEAVASSKNAPGKNSIKFLDTVIPWSELPKIMEMKGKIRGLLEDYGKDSVPRSLLSVLYATLEEKHLVEKKKIPMLRIWRLFYAFRKLMKPYRDKDKQLKELNQLLHECVTDFNLMPYLDVAVRWADYLTRREAGYERF